MSVYNQNYTITNVTIPLVIYILHVPISIIKKIAY